MLSFLALWFIDTVLLIAAAPRMEGWALVTYFPASTRQPTEQPT